MSPHHTRGEMHGCIVCGRLYQLYVVRNDAGKFVDAKVMSAGGKVVSNPQRPLVACENHSAEEIQAAVARVYGPARHDDE